MAKITHESEDEEEDDFLQALQNHNNNFGLTGLEYEEEMRLREESSLTETSSQSSYLEDPRFSIKK